jgi:isopentenyl-diphosphate delta-isomerase
MTEVILVDLNDNEIGTMEKMEAHEKGLLHRAFSVFVFNSKQELLLQKRALGKYHSEGLWTNTCCSHPSPNETNIEAAHRRLQEEMGYSCDLINTFSFIYKVELDNNLIEHELDHVVIGCCDKDPILNPEEASGFKWLSLIDIKNEIRLNPEHYTSWFKIILDEHYDKLINSIENNFKKNNNEQSNSI